MDKERDRAWELLDVYLSSVRDKNDIPLAAWTRASKLIVPKLAPEDDQSDYITFDSELAVRASIIQERYHGQTIKKMEANRSMWTDTFTEGNPTLFTKLQQILGSLTIWEHAKSSQKHR